MKLSIILIITTAGLAYANRHDPQALGGWATASLANIACLFLEYRIKLRDRVIERRCPDESFD